jgi:hypothetical protein
MSAQLPVTENSDLASSLSEWLTHVETSPISSAMSRKSISPKSSEVDVRFVFTMVENRGVARIDREEILAISKSRRWNCGL